MRRRWNLLGFTVADDPINERLDVALGVADLVSDGDASVTVTYEGSAVTGDAIGVDIVEASAPSVQSIGLRWRQVAVTIFELTTDGAGNAILNTAGDQIAISVADVAKLTATASEVATSVDLSVTGSISSTLAPQLPDNTIAVGLPSASPGGRLSFCSDETGGPTVIYSDGTNWRRVHDNAVAS
jgi:hypothetical protein